MRIGYLAFVAMQTKVAKNALVGNSSHLFLLGGSL